MLLQASEVLIFLKNQTFSVRDAEIGIYRLQTGAEPHHKAGSILQLQGCQNWKKSPGKIVGLDSLIQNLGFCLLLLLSFTSFDLSSGSCSAWAPRWE